ncbi:MAG: hypothetical protein KAS23_13415 [Anaerohalosphaera sp.]|nr:hypothetical protein [Anaerohalosphaera sp.]
MRCMQHESLFLLFFLLLIPCLCSCQKQQTKMSHITRGSRKEIYEVCDPNTQDVVSHLLVTKYSDGQYEFPTAKIYNSDGTHWIIRFSFNHPGTWFVYKFFPDGSVKRVNIEKLANVKSSSPIESLSFEDTVQYRQQNPEDAEWPFGEIKSGDGTFGRKN